MLRPSDHTFTLHAVHTDEDDVEVLLNGVAAATEDGTYLGVWGPEREGSEFPDPTRVRISVIVTSSIGAS